MHDLDKDDRLDPRARAFAAVVPSGPQRIGATREELLAEADSEQGRATTAMMLELMKGLDDETIAPREGLRFSEHELTSTPDGNTVKLQFVRPDDDEVVGCVYYIHGGGMASLSSYMGNYLTWSRLLAHHGVAVALIEFRNSIVPSAVAEVAPFPGGLNDCDSGLAWLHEQAGVLGVDPARVVVAGESGGGNLALALGLKLHREGRLALVKGLYALAPYIAGFWPQERYPSSIENDGIFITPSVNHGKVSYGVDAWERRDPLAWPGFATDEDVRGLVPTVISVNECDPLRDEGIDFYRLLIRNGVPARCRQMMGTIHANELIPSVCPDVSRDTARDLAAFCRE